MDDALLFFLSCLTGMAICLICGMSYSLKEKRVKKAEEAVGARLDAYDTLYIENKSNLISNILVIREHKINSYEYDPVKLHIGSATTGGVTVGGAYTTGGGTVVTSERSTRCELIYKHSKGNSQVSEHKIKRIILSDKLAAKANKSPVKKFLKEYSRNTIEVIKEVKPSGLFAELARTGRRNEAMSLLNFEEAQGYPTREECEAIIQWLSEE